MPGTVAMCFKSNGNISSSADNTRTLRNALYHSRLQSEREFYGVAFELDFGG